MKKVRIPSFLLLLLLIFSCGVNSQDLPYSWANKTSQDQDKIILTFTCKVNQGWHIYSSQNIADVGIPTSISLEPSTQYELISPLLEPEPHITFDQVLQSEVRSHAGTVIFKQELRRTQAKSFDVKVSIQTQACQDQGVCTRPETQTFIVSIPAEKTNTGAGLWIFIAGLGAGLLALLTPCVFPMIPMTVTFFTKQAHSKGGGVMKAVVYGVSIVVIYVTMGLGITLAFGDQALYKMASSAEFNIAFFVLLMVFAISFLGAFEITIPSRFVNNIDSKADQAGWIGIFFMAFALALVSFSCTGPIIGTLLVQTAVNGGGVGPFLGMLGFGVGLAFPFSLFAVFPSWLNKLPKSGGWLNSVKVVLGLLEIALALKFLSNADLVYQTHILTREVFIALWIAIALVLVMYLLGKIKFSHDSDLPFLSVPRSLFAVIVYMIPGMFGAPLKILSGVLPPTFYNEGWELKQGSELKNGSVKHAQTCPNGLTCYHDYDQGLKIAKSEGKPLLLDFTGLTCANCRRVEQNIWSDPQVDQLIRNEYILVSLYVDSREEIPVDQQFVSPSSGKKITTYGDKWSDLEISRYGAITQPLYVLLDHEEKMLVDKKSYTTNVDEYKKFLEEGLKEFKKRKEQD